MHIKSGGSDDHIFYPRNDPIGNLALDHSVYPLANTQRSGRLAAGETIMPALEFMVPVYSMTAILIAMTLAYIIVWWTHRSDPL